METIVNSATYHIKPFKKLRIGDPHYFDQLDRGNNPNLYKDLVCDVKTSCCRVGSVEIKEVDYDGNFSVIEVDVILAKDEDQLKIYQSGKWYGEKTLKKEYSLGCDTASYEIEVDGRYEKVHTGADGYYGEVKQMKQYYGLMMSLSFDASLFSFEEIEKLMDYLFVFKK